MKLPKFVPQFSIKVNEAQIPTALRSCVTSVQVQRGMTGADRFEFEVFNDALRWLDHDLLKSGNVIQLLMGYAPDPLQPMFGGKIVSVDANFPSSGTPTLRVAAQDALTDMQKSQQTRWFNRNVPQTTNLPKTDQDVMNEVLGEYQLTAQYGASDENLSALIGSLTGFLASALSLGDPSVPQRAVDIQIKTNDYDLIKKMASEMGYDIFMDHSSGKPNIVIVFGSWNNLSPTVELQYGKSLQEFSPRQSEVAQLTGVTANVWIAELKMSVAITLGWNWDQMAFTLAIQMGTSSAGSSDRSLMIGEPLTLGTAPKRLVSELLPKLNNRTTASGSSVGDTRIGPGALMKVTGVGEKFGGFYRVTGCTHSLDGSGYRTQFDLRKEVWFNLPKSAQGAVKITPPARIAKFQPN